MSCAGRAGDWQEQAVMGGAGPEGQGQGLPKAGRWDRAEEKVVGAKGRAEKPRGGKR